MGESSDSCRTQTRSAVNISAKCRSHETTTKRVNSMNGFILGPGPENFQTDAKPTPISIIDTQIRLKICLAADLDVSSAQSLFH